MANSTVYDIRLQYTMADKATKPLRKLDAQLAHTGKTAGGLSKTFRRLGAAAAGYFGIRAGVKHLIGFNATMEQSKIQMAGMIQLSTDMDAAASSKASSTLVDNLQKKAKASVGTTQDMFNMASLTPPPALSAGPGLSDLPASTPQAFVPAMPFAIPSLLPAPAL